ncbi:hypothetical protein M404DRAFT_35098 [Pisolithus tinctorius Marx 270]|uniref:Uncharacterized protein n=1 Tax=Pisolithus tinctorius Marx 270 TaxID=870435 RepID=A0A0C3NG24_PISTI|nr:hypothetical protein M404DRAFT_35098 [Pisolithus tinctorius Marx 270]
MAHVNTLHNAIQIDAGITIEETVDIEMHAFLLHFHLPNVQHLPVRICAILLNYDPPHAAFSNPASHCSHPFADSSNDGSGSIAPRNPTHGSPCHTQTVGFSIAGNKPKKRRLRFTREVTLISVYSLTDTESDIAKGHQANGSAVAGSLEALHRILTGHGSTKLTATKSLFSRSHRSPPGTPSNLFVTGCARLHQVNN